MLAIYKRELKSYFTSMMGYVFVAFVLVVVGIYFAAYNLNAYPLIGYTLYNVTFLFLILVPILTMRSLAEEQRNKTDQLLYTSPVSLLGIVIGKFLALISVFGIPVLVICFYPQILGQYGTVNMPMSYLAIFGFFLLGCAYIAIGMFISSITESQIIAAVISFVVLMASYQMEGIASFFSDTAVTSLIAFSVLFLLIGIGYGVAARNIVMPAVLFVLAEAVLGGFYLANPVWFEGAFAAMLKKLNLAGLSYNMIQSGILDFTNIVFYLSVIGFFLFLTVQSIKKKRWN
ncbi:MAG: ABC transporter [Lachnospiraceae bacterium]|nr:ABC transporter [Lachnospiraceae bacterium]